MTIDTSTRDDIQFPETIHIPPVPRAVVPEPTRKQRVRSLIAMGAGNTLEWFDWTVYAVFSPFIAHALFNPEDATSALLGTLAVFAAGFVFRPLGGILFGMLADRLGRRTVLITTMVTIAGASVLIAVIPSYAQIGGFASLLLLFARLLQGAAHGGESATSYAYVSEIAPPRRRGLWSSTVYVSVGTGTLLATLLGVGITAVIAPEELDAWGWRIPFLLGGFLALFALWLRRGMVETTDEDHRIEAKSSARTPRPIGERRTVTRMVLQLFFYTGGLTVGFYTWNTFASAAAISQHGMAPQDAFRASLFAQVLGIAVLPFWGFVSDRIGRRPLLIAWPILLGVSIIPLMGMLSAAPWTLFVSQTIALLLIGMGTSIFAATQAEQLPARYRTAVIGLAMSASVAVFGGTAPYLNTLLHDLGISWLYNVYFIALCAASLIVALQWKETKGIDLKYAGSPPYTTTVRSTSKEKS